MIQLPPMQTGGARGPMTSPERIEADYLLETAYDPRHAAEAMAGEQSSGTFIAIPGETPELKARAAARVEALRILDDEVREPSLPLAAAPKDASATWRRAHVTLSWPLDNLGPSLPNLLATIAGNLFELKQLSGLRLLDLRLPQAFGDCYEGPKFGIAGTRRLAGVETGPLIGTIVKPSVGLGPEDTAALTKTLCEAGIDFIKDDELQSDGPSCPFDERVRAVMRVINAHADRSGKKVMFAFNLTGDLDQMRRRHDLLLEHGATCLMASLNSVGLVGMIELARFSELPIHAHRNGWGYLSRHPLLGWSFVAWQKIWRLAGADHMHVNGLQQVRRGRRQRDRFRPRLPDAAVRRQALHRDAGVLVGPDRTARSRHLRGGRLGRPDCHRGRRHHGPSGRHGGRGRGS